VIGRDGHLPWHLPEDLAHFKRTTLGCSVIMGRKTWDSLPPKFRPLPGRLNIVITRQSDWQAAGRATRRFPGRGRCATARPAAKPGSSGGAEIYAQTLPLASTAVVTDIEAPFDGDAFAPQFGPDWVETRRERHISDHGTGVQLRHLPAPLTARTGNLTCQDTVFTFTARTTTNSSMPSRAATAGTGSRAA
jgi:dihydrofolate reductase